MMSPQDNPVPRKRVAIIGSGCAGIGALWALNRTHHDVYIYEASDRLGGRTNTVQWKSGKYTTEVDTGSIVVYTATHSNLLKFLKKIQVPTVPTSMTFAVSRDGGALEWAGSGIDAVFAQRWRLLSPQMWRMLFDIIRFNQFTLDLLVEDENTRDDDYNDNQGNLKPQMNGHHGVDTDESIAEYLSREGYSETFRDDYLIPMTAALWSMAPDRCLLDFPIVTLVRFMYNHHLLSTFSAQQPQWLTLKDGAKSYVDAVMRGFPPNHVFLNTPVKHVHTGHDGFMYLEFHDGTSACYDHVIVATHGDQAYKLVEPGSTQEERATLASFKTSSNVAYLHSDISLMPSSHRVWSSWNFLSRSALSPGGGKPTNLDNVSLTYNLNNLQGIPRQYFGDVLVTLNPLYEPHPKKTQGRFEYRHPVYSPGTARAQKQLRAIQNRRGISYAGAWTKYGFHEDGFSSGLWVAREHLGAVLPFEYTDSTYRGGGGGSSAVVQPPRLTIRDWVLRVLILLVQVLVIQLSAWVFGARNNFSRKRAPLMKKLKL